MKPIAETRVNIVTVPVTELHPNPWNPNRQSDFIFQKELKSIKDYGFLDPITARRRKAGGYEIIDGEHRFHAAKQLALRELPVNDIGEVSDRIAKKLTIILNEVKGSPDTELLTNVLTDLENEVGFDELVEDLPFTASELKTLISKDTIAWDDSADPGAEPLELVSGDWATVSLKLPKEVAVLFRAQIDRVKKIVCPTEEPDRTSHIGAIQSITRVLAQASDASFEVV